MHRPLMLGIAAAAAVLIVSVRTTAASERSTAGGLMTAKRTAMRLVERENLPPTPIGPEGAIFTGNLYDRTNETRVGRDQGVCFNTTPGMTQCTLTIFLGSSQIVLYRFIWGDGSADTVGASSSAVHTYPPPVAPATSTTFSVTLRVTDNNVPPRSGISTPVVVTVP